MNVATEHLVVADGAGPPAVRTAPQAVLAERPPSSTATLQVEDVLTKQCHEVAW